MRFTTATLTPQFECSGVSHLVEACFLVMHLTVGR